MREQRFRISPTGRGAIFRLKRWFYVLLNTSIPENAREKSKEAWQKLVTKLVEELNNRGFSEKPTRITLQYEIGPNGEFVPKTAKAEVFELSLIDTVTLNFTQQASETEKEKVKEQLKELLKKAKELGVELPEEL